MLRAFLLAALLCTSAVEAAEIRVAVAANFSGALELLATRFKELTGHEVVTISGSTGTLYAQIRAGAPFDIFLSADQARPARLVESGLALAESRFTYAVGRIVIWSGTRAVSDASALLDPDLRRIALASPELAPFGRAAKQVLQHIDANGVLNRKLVYGQNIAQAYALTATGNAEIGFVAWSSVIEQSGYWLVPETMHEPILQDAVITRNGSGKPAAGAFMQFLQSPAARQIIQRLGYATGGGLPHNPTGPGTDEGTSPPGKPVRYPEPRPAA